MAAAGAGGGGTAEEDQASKPTFPPLGDLQDSVAMQLLSDLKKQRKLSEEEYDDLSSYFSALHGRVGEAIERERSLIKKVKRTSNDVLAEQIKLERVTEKVEIETKELEQLETERERVQKEMDDAEQKDTINKYELNELERTHADLVHRRDEMQAENDALVLPELKRLEEELESLKAEFERQDTAYEREVQQKHTLMLRHEAFGKEIEDAKTELADATEQLGKAQLEPQRIRKQTESVRKAADNLSGEITKHQEKIAAAESALQKLAQKRTEADEVKASLTRKLELHQTTIEHRQTALDTLQRALNTEKAEEHELKTQRLELELKRKEVDEKLRHENEALSSAKKQYEAVKRRLRKKRQIADAARELVPTLEAQLVDCEHDLRVQEEENKALSKEIDDMKREVDLAIAQFMSQATIERDRREELDVLLKEVSSQEAEVIQWAAEERRQQKHITMLSAQRELKAREATRALKLERETKQALKIKELVILDSTKKCNEVNNRLKEFSALYDVVKNERNKFVNLIQASQQALAEMKEKIKILNNEVEILRNESLAKDRALAKEAASHTLSKAQRDSLRLELNKSQQEYRRKQESVQQQIEEVKTLNSIINGLERDMLRLKRQYEVAVEKRNETGVKLIDRNDELCILYEKANLQEATFTKGEAAVRQREDEIRVLKLELAELERHVMAKRQNMPNTSILDEQAKRLSEQLQREKERTAKLCSELEDPGNGERWRSLGGEDPDMDQLFAKVTVLEARLDEKKEQLLEKELVLEEVTTLTQKLRNRAGDGREDTLKMAKRINDFQARIRDTTRRMMATVSELSMYQATAMKLQQERNARLQEVEESRWRVSHGEAPSEEAEREWYRAEQQMLARHEARLLEPTAPQEGGLVPHKAVRTTAEARPNAYIPDDLGIPKPYGGLAPFKPTEPGTTMRHIRAPNPPDIQI